MAGRDVGKLGVGAAALIVAEASLAHFGVPGILLGGAAAWAAYEYSDPLVSKWTEKKPSQSKRAKKAGKRSFASRLLTGKSVRSEMQEDDPLAANYNEPEYEDEDELPDDVLDLGPQLRPHVNTVFSNRMAILGQPGSGKSNALADLIEELGRFDAPLLALDQKPEYEPLCSLPFLSNPYHANASTVTPQNAFRFGIWMMNERKQVVLDLASYKNDTTAAKVMIQILAAIWTWEAALHNDDRIPCMVFLEEAHYWLPQQENMSTVSRAKNDEGESIFSRLQQSFFSLATGGRSLGIGLVVSTQRPADIDNRVISGAPWKILLRADLPADLKVYRSLGCDNETAMALEVGQAFIQGPGFKGVYQFRERFSPSDAKTPGYEALSKATPVYTHPLPGNTETLVNTPVNEAVNRSTSDFEAQQESPRLRLLETDVNGPDEQETPPGATVNVNADTRKYIRRMAEHGMKHRDIAKIVGLNGRYYDIYKLVCIEEGIKIEKEA